MDTSGGNQSQPPKGGKLADLRLQEQTPPQPQSVQPSLQQPISAARPGAAKEQESLGKVGDTERVPIVELREPRELPEAVAGWLERVERDDIPEPATIVHEGKAIVSPAAPNQAQVTLPLTADDLKKGLQQKLIESIRWLAEWCVRLMKKYHGKAVYKLQNKA